VARQGIDPLVVAANLWTKTHAIEPAVTTTLGDDADLTAPLNGKQIDGAFQIQNDETQPILRPEAG
jgi:hypothetical protein